MDCSKCKHSSFSLTGSASGMLCPDCWTTENPDEAVAQYLELFGFRSTPMSRAGARKALGLPLIARKSGE